MGLNGKPVTYGCTALTGGAAGALDTIDGSGLIEGDRALVVLDTEAFYVYRLSASSGASESSPSVISPDSNAGTKRWLLCGQGGTVNVHTHADATQGGTISYDDLTDTPAAHTTASASITSNVTMDIVGTWYDGPTVSLAAGTWLVIGSACFSSGGGVQTACRITDGSTHYSSSEAIIQVAGDINQLAMSAVITLGGTTTIKLQGKANNTSAALLAAGSYAATGNIATQIHAVRIA